MVKGGFMDTRTLSDADIEAIVDALETRATSKLYNNVGKTVVSLLWKAATLSTIGFELYKHLL